MTTLGPFLGPLSSMVRVMPDRNLSSVYVHFKVNGVKRCMCSLSITKQTHETFLEFD